MKVKDEEIRLLLVDDEEDFLASTTSALERRGVAVTTARDGMEGLQLIKQEEFDVVVLDEKMPGLSGEDVFRYILRLKPGLPVIFLTGHGTAQQAFETSRDGAYEYVAKPCDVDRLARMARAAVLNSRKKGEAN